MVPGLKGWDHQPLWAQLCSLCGASLHWSRPLHSKACRRNPHLATSSTPHPPNSLRVQVFVCVLFFFGGDCVVRVGIGAWWIVLKGVKLLKSYRVKSPGMEEHDGGLSPPSTSFLSVLDYILKGFLRFRALHLLCCYLLFDSERTCGSILSIQAGAFWGSIVFRYNISTSIMDSVSILMTRKKCNFHILKRKNSWLLCLLL